jgi:hypothetical protein
MMLKRALPNVFVSHLISIARAGHSKDLDLDRDT